MASRTRRDRHGSYGIILALSVPALIGMTAIAVDLSYQKVVRAELQGASDIAAAAGAAQLDGTYAGLVRAKNAAMRAAARNNAHGSLVPLQPGDIEFGYWDFDGWGWVGSDDPVLVDAMRVSVRHEEIGTSFAAAAFAQRDVAARAWSTAYQPPDSSAGAVRCYLPLAVAECIFDTYSPEELKSLELTLNPAGVDNVGWGRLGGSTPNASWTRAQLSNCEQDGEARVGDDVGLQNGVVSSAMKEMVTVMKASSTSWDTEAWGPIPPQASQSDLGGQYGKTLEGAILVFDGGDEYCEGSGGAFNGYEPLVGFVWAAIYDVRTKGGAADKNIWVRLDPDADEAVGIIPGGRVRGGVNYDEPVVLVK